MASKRTFGTGMLHDTACVQCQLTKVHCHTMAPLLPFKLPEQQFDHVNIDLRPLPVLTHLLTLALIHILTVVLTHLLTVVDRATNNKPYLWC